MTLQNRVLPTSDIVAIPARGTLTGNRGIIHGPDRVLTTRRWSHKVWISCEVAWQNRKRAVMTGRNWTELFFLDEAVALAAGHRPCGYCRRADYTRFLDAWEAATGIRPRAPEVDAILHPARITRNRVQIRHTARIATLPANCMVLKNGQAHLVRHHSLLPFSPDGYGPPIPRPRCGDVTVLTPAPLLAVLDNGYVPRLHPSAI